MELGIWGECYVLKYLINRGYIFLLSNLRNRYTEVDLVFLHPNQDKLIAVEVKTTLSTYWQQASLGRLHWDRFARKNKLLQELSSRLGLQKWSIQHDLVTLLVKSQCVEKRIPTKVEHLQDIYI